MCYPIYRLAEEFVIVKMSCKPKRIFPDVRSNLVSLAHEIKRISKQILAYVNKACLNDEIWLFTR
jgi:hypothetical protein